MTDLDGATLKDIVDRYVAKYELKMLLTTADYVFDPDTHTFRSDVTDEVVGDGYAVGGVGISGIRVVQNTDLSRVEITADDVEFARMTVSDIAQAVVYFSDGDPDEDRIFTVNSFTPEESPVDQFFYYEWDAPDIRGVVGYIEY